MHSLESIAQGSQTRILRACCDLPSRFDLHHGGYIQDGRVAFTLYGQPEAPCVLVIGGISAGRDIAHQTDQFASGWWRYHLGEGNSIDLTKYCVLGIDYLGGNGESSAPERDSDQTRQAISTFDQANAIGVVLSHLGIERLAAAIGSSYGGMVTLALACQSTITLGKALVISAADQPDPVSTALREIQRQIVLLGHHSAQPKQALKLARALAMITYRSADEFRQRFANDNAILEHGFHADVIDYLNNRGELFSQRFSAKAFYRLSQSIDLHRVELSQLSCPLTCVSVLEDKLIPHDSMQRMAAKANAELQTLQSIYGHDAFLKEQQSIAWIIKKFLTN